MDAELEASEECLPLLASISSKAASCIPPYLSSATVARYKPSGEKHTDRRELMWTSLSSMTGSSWV